MYMCMYICICVYVYIYIHIHVYIYFNKQYMYNYISICTVCVKILYCGIFTDSHIYVDVQSIDPTPGWLMVMYRRGYLMFRQSTWISQTPAGYIPNIIRSHDIPIR